MPDFVHLHTHSDFSLLDGAASVSKLVAKTVDLGIKHLALTDHGNMFGSIQFYKECKAHNINPIIGSEFYVAPISRFKKGSAEGKTKLYHMVLLAISEIGYRNLMIAKLIICPAEHVGKNRRFPTMCAYSTTQSHNSQKKNRHNPVFT